MAASTRNTGPRLGPGHHPSASRQDGGWGQLSALPWCPVAPRTESNPEKQRPDWDDLSAVFMTETELPCREMVTCLINPRLQNGETLSPSKECKGTTDVESRQEPYPNINLFQTLLYEETPGQTAWEGPSDKDRMSTLGKQLDPSPTFWWARKWSDSFRSLPR